MIRIVERIVGIRSKMDWIIERIVGGTGPLFCKLLHPFAFIHYLSKVPAIILKEFYPIMALSNLSRRFL